ncbi:MAG TPA: 2-phospho-L-lactate transferase [Caulobacteraceae bacterium]|nr:2-phospho-L-lactate transferase [Caulobacteraceae bacterium]
MSQAAGPGRVLALCGGVGGAKLAFGLAAALPEDELTVVVNTGDDFQHLGLEISPDIDTVTYTLAGLADRERGWGSAGDTWNFLGALARLGGEDWFQIGDRDLALHVERTRRLKAGESLSEVTADLARRLTVKHSIVPMSDQPVRTWLDTEIGPLPFQHYFVREHCLPVVRGVRFEGVTGAQPSPDFARDLARRDLAAIVICPSNPYLSIDPILAVPGVAEAISAAASPRVAVSPLVGGRAVKGPTAKLMAELGVPGTVTAIADHYVRLIDAMVIDIADADQASCLEARGLAVHVTQTVMTTDQDRVRLATETLDFARSLRTLAQPAASL